MSNLRSTAICILLVALYTTAAKCSALGSTENKDKCTGTRKSCVRRHLCVNGVINTTGEDLFDVRVGANRTCGFLEVCCSLPLTSSIETSTFKVDESLLDSIFTKTPPTKTTDEVTTPLPMLSNSTKNDGKVCKGANRVCVQYFLCVNGVINTSGEGIFDVRLGADNVCSDFEVCCNLSPTIPIETSTPKLNDSSIDKGSEVTTVPSVPNNSTISIGTKCIGIYRVCVGRYLCVNGVINTNGKDLIDVRIGVQKECNILEVCCNLPQSNVIQETSTVETTVETTTTTSVDKTNDNDSGDVKCSGSRMMCVKRLLCVNGVIRSNGMQLPGLQNSSEKSCGFLEVCCSLPDNKSPTDLMATANTDCSTLNGPNVVMRIVGPNAFATHSSVNLLAAKSRNCIRYGAQKAL